MSAASHVYRRGGGGLDRAAGRPSPARLSRRVSASRRPPASASGFTRPLQQGSRKTRLSTFLRSNRGGGVDSWVHVPKGAVHLHSLTPKKHQLFRVSSVKLRNLHPMWEDRGSLQDGRYGAYVKLIFCTLLGTIYEKICSPCPLEKDSGCSGVATGGKRGNLPPPPPPLIGEIDADPRRFSCRKMGIGLQDLLPSSTCIDATADVLWSYDYEKRGSCRSC